MRKLNHVEVFDITTIAYEEDQARQCCTNRSVAQEWIIFDLNEISKQYCIDLSRSIFSHLIVINLLSSIANWTYLLNDKEGLDRCFGGGGGRGINWWLVIQELVLTVGGSL
jgi:hypothetical protein